MTMSKFMRWFAALVLLAGQHVAAGAETIPYTLTIENNTELNLTISVRQTSDIGAHARWDIVRHTFEVGPVSTVKQTFRAHGRMQVVFTPSRCGNPRAFPELKVETWALPNQSSKYYVLKDSDFGKSLILPQCPERLAESEQCIRAREEVARLEALRQEPDLLTKFGWDLSGRITMANSAQTVYDRIEAIEREKGARLRANPLAVSTDPVYRNMVQEQNQLKDLYNAQMAKLIRQQPDLARRNIVDVASLKARIADAQTRWQAEGQYRHPQATAERDRACER